MSEVRKRPRFHWGIILILSFLVLAVTFAAYMVNTSLEETLVKERSTSIITHDYTYDSMPQAQTGTSGADSTGSAESMESSDSTESAAAAESR